MTGILCTIMGLAGSVSYWMALFKGASSTTGEGASSVVVDSLGNPVVAGYSSTGAWVCKIDENCGVVWQRFLAQTGYTTSAVAIDLDPSDNIYIGGDNPISSTSRYFMLAKYNASGVIQWQRRYGSTSVQSSVSGLVVDSSGNSYLYGTYNSTGSAGTPYQDPALMKYNTSGTLQFVRNPVRTTASDYAYDISLDFSNNVYCVFQSSGGVGRGVAKFNGSGSIQWSFSTVSSGIVIRAVKVASDGSVYLAGISSSTFGNGFCLFKLDSSGSVVWGRKLTGSLAAAGEPNKIDIDPDGNVYVCGNDGSTTPDCYLFKYSSSGVIQWQRSFSSTGRDYFFGISVKESHLYIAGRTTVRNGSGSVIADALVLKLPLDGSLTGTYTIDGYSFTYAASALTDAEITVTTGTAPTPFTPSYTGATSTMIDSAGNLTPVVTNI